MQIDCKRQVQKQGASKETPIIQEKGDGHEVAVSGGWGWDGVRLCIQKVKPTGLTDT